MNNKAFSIIESIAVIFIILIITAVTVPNYFRFASRKKLDTAARNIQTTLRSARSHAVTRRENVTVSFDQSNNTYEVTDSSGDIIDKIYSLPDVIVIHNDTTRFDYSFTPAGSLGQGGSVVIQNTTDSSKKTITVIGSTGRATVQ
jgi:Tfp pilus assembly protein FimT